MKTKPKFLKHVLLASALLWGTTNAFADFCTLDETIETANSANLVGIYNGTTTDLSYLAVMVLILAMYMVNIALQSVLTHT